MIISSRLARLHFTRLMLFGLVSTALTFRIIRLKEPEIGLHDKFTGTDQISRSDSRKVDDIFVSVGVLSACRNKDRRDAIRETWGQHHLIQKVSFFLAVCTDGNQKELVLREGLQNDDIIIVSYLESYQGIANSTLSLISTLSHDNQISHIMKVDDDSYVSVDKLYHFLLDLNMQHEAHIGHFAFNAKPIRDPGSKWYMSPTMWKSDRFPPFAHGAGYILTRKLARKIAAGVPFLSNISILNLEDVSVGIWVEFVERSGLNVSRVHDDRFSFRHQCKSENIVNHYVLPGKQYCLFRENGLCNACP